MKTVYREKRYYCGEYLDVYIYPTYRQGRSRGKRSKPTSAAQVHSRYGKGLQEWALSSSRHAIRRNG